MAIPLELKTLVRMIARAFYDDKTIIFLDMLTEDRVLRDDVIAMRVKMNPKDSNKFLGRLKEDRLLKSETKTEPKLNEWRKPILKTYYYIDYSLFVNVVKYKLLKMREYIESNTQVFFAYLILDWRWSRIYMSYM